MNCPLCKNDKCIEFVEDYPTYLFNYKIYICHSCALQFSYPMKAALASHYETVEWYGNRWEFNEMLIFFSNKTGKILEIGCGEGYFLVNAQEKGFNITGIDFNKSAVEVAKKKGLEKVFSLSLEEFIQKFPHEKFDIICFYHVLEHLENPVNFIEMTKILLKPDGYLAFSFPNPNRFKLRRENWDYPPHHLTRWNGKSIEYLLGKTGFKKIFVNEEPLSIYGTTESIGSFLESKFFKKQSLLTNKTNNKKNYYLFKKIFKPALLTLLYPFGLVLYCYGKVKNLKGQAIFFIAKRAD